MTALSFACDDGSPVAAANESAAELAVNVEAGDLGATDISSVHIVARYTGAGGAVTLRELTQPYAQGESRRITLPLDLTNCLREAPTAGAQAGCAVQVTVEVLAGTRVVVRDELPVVQVHAGDKLVAPALAARTAATIRLRANGGAVTSPITLTVGGTATIAADPLDQSGSPIAGRTVVWSTSDAAVVSVTAAGLVTALAPGTAIVTGSNTGIGGTVRATATVNVAPMVPANVALTPSAATVDAGATRQLDALVRDAANQTVTPQPVLAWTTSQASVATVSATGLVTGVAPGAATITARTANGVTGTTTITVLAVPSAVLISPSAPSLAIGATQPLTATVNDAAGVAITPTPSLTWSTSAATIATVSQSGVVTSVAPGNATISARLANGVTGSAVVTVLGPPPAAIALSPATANVSVGATQSLTITVRDASGAVITPTPSVTWSSAQNAIATVSATGIVTGVAPGTATITARASNGVTGTAAITVVAVPARVVLSSLPAPFYIGDTETLTASVSDAAGAAITPVPALAWGTSASDVATVSQTGVVTAVAPGTATITARTANGMQGTTTAIVLAVPVAASLQLAPSLLSVGVGANAALTPTARDAAGNVIARAQTLFWQTSNPGVAIVSSAGVVTGVSPGFATITARTLGGVSASATANVGATGSFSGRVYAADNNVGVAGATITVSVPAGVVRTVVADADGNFNTGPLFGGPFDLRVTASGFVLADVRNLTVNGARTLEAIPLARSSAVGDGTIRGTVSNATTRQPILSNVVVELYAGLNPTPGAPIAATSVIAGNYRFDAPAGTYTVLARATGFSMGTRTVVSPGGGVTVNSQNLALSPVASVGGLRIVLTWGDEPADLDAYLIGPLERGGTFNVNWDSRGSCTSAPFACLDQDATEGRGPESITIAEKVPGVYTFYVHDYTDADEGATSLGLARSNARVDVYNAAGLVASFAAPSQPGTLWTVFTWNGTTITPVNTVNGNPPPQASAAGATGAESALRAGVRAGRSRKVKR